MLLRVCIAEMKLVVCDTGSKADMLIKAASRMPSLKVLIVIREDTLTQDIIDLGQTTGIDVRTFTEALVIVSLKIL